jgi:hypothetical protein
MCYQNFLQGNNAQKGVWSHILQRSAQGDSKEIYLAFSKVYSIFINFGTWSKILGII